MAQGWRLAVWPSRTGTKVRLLDLSNSEGAELLRGLPGADASSRAPAGTFERWGLGPEVYTGDPTSYLFVRVLGHRPYARSDSTALIPHGSPNQRPPTVHDANRRSRCDGAHHCRTFATMSRSITGQTWRPGHVVDLRYTSRSSVSWAASIVFDQLVSSQGGRQHTDWTHPGRYARTTMSRMSAILSLSRRTSDEARRPPMSSRACSPTTPRVLHRRCSMSTSPPGLIDARRGSDRGVEAARP